ncbi:ABC transporter permease [Balneola sp. EhC07]|uniref:ABC transporter permease n=1 Tax=Balneola sp. EhC07 TaxID=1849360 RepID=UPI0007F39BEB|nr:ABC transporter permease [Balneola sp. EhC07]OAN61009.1 ABC transporter permease [Balneola sp. EhC07]
MDFTKGKRVFSMQVLLIVLVGVLWEILASQFNQFKFLLGSPSSVGQELVALIINENFFYHFFLTGSEALVGFLIGTSLGTTCGLLLWYSEFTSKVMKPFIIVMGSIPVFAFAPLLVVWFGIGFWMKVVLAFLSTFFIALTNAHKGATLVSNQFLDLLEIYGADKRSKFFKVVLPGSIEWVLNSLRLNIGFALLGAFIGEFISSENGLGRLILRATGLYNVPKALAAAIGIILLAFIFDFIAGKIESKRHSIIQLISVPKALKN